MSNHAYLSASGASKWMNCTPSRKLEEQYPESTSIFAEEGSLAHELAEIQLAYELDRLTSKEYKAAVKKIEKHELYQLEMPVQVQKYVDYVLETYNTALAVTEDATILLEEKLDFSDYVPEGFGTGDNVIVYDGVLLLTDFKYGKGVKVDAVDNPQLKLYALGALDAYNFIYAEIEKVVLTIVQPRLDHISVFEISTEELLQWAVNSVMPAAKAAFVGEGELRVGSWCRWCKAKARCTAYAQLATIAAKNEFAEPLELTDEQMIEAFADIDKIRDWLKAVEDYMLEQAKHGKQWKGYKLVNGKSRRKWTDEAKVAAQLKKLGFAKKKYIAEKLVGITKVSQMMSVDKFEENFKPLLFKSVGGLVLVPEDDKRIAIGAAQAKMEFND